MKRSIVIKINVYLISLWYLLMPLSGSTNIFNLGNTKYDPSRLIGILIVFINTILLPSYVLKKIPKLILYFVGMFLFWAMLGVFHDPDLESSINVFIRVYSGFLIFMAFCNLDNDLDKVLVEKLIMLVGLFSACYLIFQYSFYMISPASATHFFGEREFIATYSTVRPLGPLRSAGGSSSVILTAILLILKRLLDNKVGKSDFLFCIILLTALLINFTRTYVFILPPIFIITLLFKKRYKYLFYSTALFAFVMLIMITFVGLSHFEDRFKDMVVSKEINKNQVMQGRGLLIEMVYDDYNKKDIFRKLTGDGISYTNKLLGKYFHQVEVSTHDDFMWLLSNLGILGVVLYLLFYAGAAVSYRGELRPLYLCFLFGVMFVSGLGGETICVTGHRILQMVFLAYLLKESSIQPAEAH